MPGRKQDSIWVKLERSRAGTGYKTTCNACGLRMQGIPSCMRAHLETCNGRTAQHTQEDIEEEENIPLVAVRAATNQTPEATPSTCLRAKSLSTMPKIKKRKTLDDYTTKTTVVKASKLDTLIANMVYATNSSF